MNLRVRGVIAVQYGTVKARTDVPGGEHQQRSGGDVGVESWPIPPFVRVRPFRQRGLPLVTLSVSSAAKRSDQLLQEALYRLAKSRNVADAVVADTIIAASARRPDLISMAPLSGPSRWRVSLTIRPWGS